MVVSLLHEKSDETFTPVAFRADAFPPLFLHCLHYLAKFNKR